MKNFFRPKKSEGDSPPSKKIGYLIILGLTGVFLIIVSNIFSSEDEPELDMQPQGETQNTTKADDAAEMSSSDMSHVEERLGQDLAAMLNKIQSVTDAEVMVNLNATSEHIYEKNTTKGQQITDESDRNGGTRKIEDNTEDSQVVTIRKGDQEMPLLVQTKQPEVRGCL